MYLYCNKIQKNVGLIKLQTYSRNKLSLFLNPRRKPFSVKTVNFLTLIGDGFLLLGVGTSGIFGIFDGFDNFGKQPLDDLTLTGDCSRVILHRGARWTLLN